MEETRVQCLLPFPPILHFHAHTRRMEMDIDIHGMSVIQLEQSNEL